jgi:transcriptional regulator with XRE-family HTH domain
VGPPIRQVSSTAEDVRKKLGTRIRYLRLQLGLSQEELAGRCGLDRTYVGGIERAERNPSLKNIFIIATALQVPISGLFDDTTQPSRTPNPKRR